MGKSRFVLRVFLAVEGEVPANLGEPGADILYFRPFGTSFPGTEQGILHDIFGLGCVEGDAEGQAIETIAMRKDIGAEVHGLQHGLRGRHGFECNHRSSLQVMNIGDANLGDASPKGSKGILQLGNHPAGDGAISYEGAEIGLREVGNEGGGI